MDIYIYVYVYMYICVCIYILYIYAHSYTYVYIHTHIFMYIYIYTYHDCQGCQGVNGGVLTFGLHAATALAHMLGWGFTEMHTHTCTYSVIAFSTLSMYVHLNQSEQPRSLEKMHQ